MLISEKTFYRMNGRIKLALGGQFLAPHYQVAPRIRWARRFAKECKHG